MLNFSDKVKQIHRKPLSNHLRNPFLTYRRRFLLVIRLAVCNLLLTNTGKYSIYFGYGFTTHHVLNKCQPLASIFHFYRGYKQQKSFEIVQLFPCQFHLCKLEKSGFINHFWLRINLFQRCLLQFYHILLSLQ